MENVAIYEDIAQRTDGDIYIGVVGPVRTGKSTFIKRFMETMVIPHIDNPYQRERARDELPQSASGKTVMTAEPKFVPEDAVEITIGRAHMQVRLIDCVGYMVEGALGQTEDGEPRMVTTPWFDKEITMSEAAEIGTKKVITDHATIGMVITTDGTISDFEREAYLPAEERVIEELKAIGKPFLVVINSASPQGSAALRAKEYIDGRYGVNSVIADCMSLGEESVADLIRSVLYEFPVRELNVNLPAWVNGIPADHWLKTSIYASVLSAAGALKKIGDMDRAVDKIAENEYLQSGSLSSMNLGEGSVFMAFDMDRSLFYKVLSEQSGFEIHDDGDLPALLTGLGKSKRKYDRVASALEQVYNTGYGIVLPALEELKLEEPVIVKQGGRFGVRLSAQAPSIHMMRADIKTEISPVVGSEKQSEDLVNYLLKEFEEDTSRIWESNIFGKSLHELVNEGLNSKLNHMPSDAQEKLRETLERIINEGSGGLICIIL